MGEPVAVAHETVEEMYADSVRRHHERRRRELQAAWYGFHEHMRELHARLSREHEEKAMKLLEGDI